MHIKPKGNGKMRKEQKRNKGRCFLSKKKIKEKHPKKNSIIKEKTPLGKNTKKQKGVTQYPRKHQCTLCKSSFRFMSQLKQHIRIHTGERPYICHICGAMFAQTSNLKKHCMCHTGEKPHQCHYCSRSFTQTSNLKVHLRTHTGERPYVCSSCGATFSQSSNLKKHKETHQGSIVPPSTFRANVEKRQLRWKKGASRARKTRANRMKVTTIKDGKRVNAAEYFRKLRRKIKRTKRMKGSSTTLVEKLDNAMFVNKDFVKSTEDISKSYAAREREQDAQNCEIIDIGETLVLPGTMAEGSVLQGQAQEGLALPGEIPKDLELVGQNLEDSFLPGQSLEGSTMPKQILENLVLPEQSLKESILPEQNLECSFPEKTFENANYSTLAPSQEVAKSKNSREFNSIVVKVEREIFSNCTKNSVTLYKGELETANKEKVFSSSPSKYASNVKASPSELGEKTENLCYIHTTPTDKPLENLSTVLKLNLDMDSTSIFTEISEKIIAGSSYQRKRKKYYKKTDVPKFELPKSVNNQLHVSVLSEGKGEQRKKKKRDLPTVLGKKLLVKKPADSSSEASTIIFENLPTQNGTKVDEKYLVDWPPALKDTPCDMCIKHSLIKSRKTLEPKRHISEFTAALEKGSNPKRSVEMKDLLRQSTKMYSDDLCNSSQASSQTRLNKISKPLNTQVKRKSCISDSVTIDMVREKTRKSSVITGDRAKRSSDSGIDSEIDMNRKCNKSDYIKLKNREILEKPMHKQFSSVLVNSRPQHSNNDSSKEGKLARKTEHGTGSSTREKNYHKGCSCDSHKMSLDSKEMTHGSRMLAKKKIAKDDLSRQSEASTSRKNTDDSHMVRNLTIESKQMRDATNEFIDLSYKKCPKSPVQVENSGTNRKYAHDSLDVTRSYSKECSQSLNVVGKESSTRKQSEKNVSTGSRCMKHDDSKYYTSKNRHDSRSESRCSTAKKRQHHSSSELRHLNENILSRNSASKKKCDSRSQPKCLDKYTLSRDPTNKKRSDLSNELKLTKESSYKRNYDSSTESKYASKKRKCVHKSSEQKHSKTDLVQENSEYDQKQKYFHRSGDVIEKSIEQKIDLPKCPTVGQEGKAMQTLDAINTAAQDPVQVKETNRPPVVTEKSCKNCAHIIDSPYVLIRKPVEQEPFDPDIPSVLVIEVSSHDVCKSETSFSDDEQVKRETDANNLPQKSRECSDKNG
ncbi:uncharacterized protein LOC143022149 isoform X2 [Oratosquilla oratoria]